MNIAIVIYSKTDTTLNIARRPASLFTDAKIKCNLIRLVNTWCFLKEHNVTEKN